MQKLVFYIIQATKICHFKCFRYNFLKRQTPKLWNFHHYEVLVLGNAPDSDANITVWVDQSLKFMVEGSPLAPALYALISDAQLHRITLGLLSVVVHYFS